MIKLRDSKNNSSLKSDLDYVILFIFNYNSLYSLIEKKKNNYINTLPDKDENAIEFEFEYHFLELLQKTFE